MPPIITPLISLTDAQEMQRKNPRTFSAPTADEIMALRTRAHVKVCAGRERFWVQITAASFIVYDPFRSTFRGRIDNDLVYTTEHGLLCDDIITFEGRHIYSTNVP